MFLFIINGKYPLGIMVKEDWADMNKKLIKFNMLANFFNDGGI